MRNKRLFAALAALVLVAGNVVASAPAGAVDFTTARVTMAYAGSPSGSWVYSLADGDHIANLNQDGFAGLAWSRSDGSQASSLSVDLRLGHVLNVGNLPAFSGAPQTHLNTDLVPCHHPGSLFISEIELNPEGGFSKLDMHFRFECDRLLMGRIQLNVPLQPHPAPGPAVLFAGNATSSGSAVVWAHVTDAASASSVRARFISMATGQEVAFVVLEPVISFPPPEIRVWAWAMTQHLVPGIYRIDTEVVDRSGNMLAQTDVGRFVWDYDVGFGETWAQDLTYHNRTVLVGGRLRASDPYVGTEVPMPGETATAVIHWASGPPTTRIITPDAQGFFSFPVTSDVGIRVDLIYAGNPARNLRPAWTSVVIQTQDALVEIQTDPEYFSTQTMAVSGTATFHSGEWRPLANAQIQVFDVFGDESRLATTVTTDAQGRFAFTHTAQFWPLGVVQLVTVSDNIFIPSTVKALPNSRYHPGVSIDVFFGFWVDEGVAEFVGLLTVPGTPPPNFAFVLQQQTAQGWRVAGWAAPVRDPEFGPDAWMVSIEAPVPCHSSVWRLTYGLGQPGAEKITDPLTASRSCGTPRRSPGDRDTGPRRP